MSVDKLIDSTKLDACCTAEANAIRAKTGGSSQLSYDWANSKGFADAIAAIPSGGGGYTADDWLDNSKPVGDIRSSVYSVTGQYGTYVRLFNKTSIGRLIIENSPWVEERFASSSSITLFSGHKTHSIAANALQNCANLTTVELGSTTTGTIVNEAFAACGSLDTLILRSTSVKALRNTNAFGWTPFASGGTGGTIYIPKSLYDHLGDGTSSDYKAATNWSTLDGYGTVTWAKIEGSIYETHYADGTPIPTT